MHARFRELFRLNAIYLALVIFIIFVLPAIRGQFAHYLFPPTFSTIFVVAAFSYHGKRKPVLLAALILTVLYLLSTFLDLKFLNVSTQVCQIIFFGYLVLGLIREISSETKVTKAVMLASITGYLLLGFALSLFVGMVHTLIPDAYQMNQSIKDESINIISEIIYYTFVTFSTTGYGDIVPLHPVAKSLAILIGISGQLYIAIIIAMLVGKIAANKN